jgi:RNA recognition motif-containing protein
MNLIVLNLPRQTTEKQLIELFKTHGVVVSCDIIKDKETGKSKGFGFVDMKNDDEAEAAIKTLHGTEFFNQKIRVKVTKDKE